MIKTGQQHLASIRDGRCIFIDGEKVSDPTNHPAFRQAAATVARLYDFQAAPENRDLMTFELPGTGRRVNRAWQMPRSYDELVQRRKALVAWAELHCGYMGRSPDHVASTISAMAMAPDLFEAHGKGRGRAVTDYYRYAAERDLYLSYVIIDPQADRSKATGEQQDEYLTAGICDEDATGITIRGAKMLGTGAVLSNEIFVAALRPLKTSDDKYAFSAVVPIDAPGVKMLSRRSYEESATSRFDYPMSAQFDENDSVLYFDDVKVPWERVFVCRSPEMSYGQFHATPAHSYQNYQAQIRLMVKLRYLVGLAKRITETIGTAEFPQVKETLGTLAAKAGMVEAFVYGMEAKGSHFGDYFMPDKALLYASSVLSQQLYPEITTLVRDLAGGGMIMLPSHSDDFANPEIAEIIGKTQRAANTDAIGRVKLFKLAWDSIGSEFASRHTQYEMFYSGAKVFTTGHAARTYDWAKATKLVDDRLAEQHLPAGKLRSAAE